MYLRKTVSALALLLTTHATLAQPTSRPADEKEVILSLLIDLRVAMRTGDPKFVLANTLLPDAAKPEWEASGNLGRTRAELFQLVAKRFEVPPRFPTYDEATERQRAQVLLRSKVDVQGDVANVEMPGNPPAITVFKKVNGRWMSDRSDFVPSPDRIEQERARTKLYVEVRQAVEAGTVKSFADFEAAMTARGLDWKSARP